MSHYTLINPKGKHCGVKALTDSMADRLEDHGWQVIPADEKIASAPKITFWR